MDENTVYVTVSRDWDEVLYPGNYPLNMPLHAVLIDMLIAWGLTQRPDFTLTIPGQRVQPRLAHTLAECAPTQDVEGVLWCRFRLTPVVSY